jgi:hypothetical protein
MGTVNEDEERNKALVIEAFDTLFHKRDYAAAERFWSPAVAVAVAGGINPAGPVHPPGKYAVPATMPYGTYGATIDFGTGQFSNGTACKPVHLQHLRRRRQHDQHRHLQFVLAGIARCVTFLRWLCYGLEVRREHVVIRAAWSGAKTPIPRPGAHAAEILDLKHCRAASWISTTAAES